MTNTTRETEQRQRMDEVMRLTAQIKKIDLAIYEMDELWLEAKRSRDWPRLPELEMLERELRELTYRRDDIREEHARNTDYPDIYRFDHIREREARNRRGEL